MNNIKAIKLFLAVTVSIVTNAYGQKQKVWIDADTGNETDDVYAIVRLLKDTSINVIGLSSAHFNNSDLIAFKKWNQYNTIGIKTVEISQQLNQEILKLSGKEKLIHPLGADRQIGRSWGGVEPRSSAATLQIINVVKALRSGEKLHVICLGALTNIASAIIIDTGITSKLKVFLLGVQYDTKKKCWNKNEFNIRNDLNAFDYLLNNPLVDLQIMPINTAKPFLFQRDSLFDIFNGSNPVLMYLKNRWQETNPESTVRTLWDAALAEAYLKPALCTVQNVLTPPENTQHNVKVYTGINTVKMKLDFLEFITQLKKQ